NRVQTLLLGACLLGAASVWALSRTDWGALLITVVSLAVVFIAFPPEPEVPTWNVTHLPRLDENRTYMGFFGMEDILARRHTIRPNIGTHSEMLPGNLPMLTGVHYVNGYSPI